MKNLPPQWLTDISVWYASTYYVKTIDGMSKCTKQKLHIIEQTYTFRDIVLPVSCMAKAHPEKSPLILFQLILNQPRYNLIRKSQTVKTLTLSLLQKVNSLNLLCFNINPPLSQHIFLKLTKHWYQYQNLFITLSYVS